MLVEFGNHNPAFPGPDDRPKVTSINIPEFDAEFRKHTPTHYGHEVGAITAQQFKDHLADALAYNQGITNLPGHEALLSIQAAWTARAKSRPAWVKVTDHDHPGLTPKGKSADIEKFLSEYYECPTLEGYHGDCSTDEAHVRKEIECWTKCGAPGEYYSGVPTLPDAKALYTVDGRIMNNNNDGGDTLQSVMMGTGSAASGTTLTTGQTLVTNATAGHRVYVRSAAGTFVWGNCISNTNAAAASVITVDQWYVPLTPGGSVGTTPAAFDWVIVDGGMISTWFAGIGTGGTPTVTNTDHTLATGGQTEYTQAGGTLIRKICPTAVDVSVSARTVTLVPVFTANASDVGNLPKVFDIVGFFASMVIGFGGAGGPMKFEDAISPTATIAALGDNVTLTETISGS